MPKYKAYRFSSARASRMIEFGAADDDAAKAIAIAADYSNLTPYNVETEDDEDALIDLHRVGDMGDEVVGEGMEIPDQKPYGWDAVTFLQRLANAEVHAVHLMVEGEPWSLPGIVRRARAICGLPALERPKVRA